MLHMCCCHSYTFNKIVFSLHLNMSIPTSDVRSSAGRLFHERRNCGRCSSSWCGEQPVDRSQQTGDVADDS